MTKLQTELVSDTQHINTKDNVTTILFKIGYMPVQNVDRMYGGTSSETLNRVRYKLIYNNYVTKDIVFIDSILQKF